MEIKLIQPTTGDPEIIIIIPDMVVGSLAERISRCCFGVGDFAARTTTVSAVGDGRTWTREVNGRDMRQQLRRVALGRYGTVSQISKM